MNKKRILIVVIVVAVVIVIGALIGTFAPSLMQTIINMHRAV